MLPILSVLLLSLPISAQPPYSCGKKEIHKRPYGTVELRVLCDLKEDNILSVIEYKDKVQHGIQVDYDSLWRKRDSSFFVNGKEEGQCLFWDTLGNIVARRTYRKGKYVGLYESYWAPGKPSIIKTYNAQGKTDGPWKEWWKNGNPKVDVISKNGTVLSGTEYYPDGKPRLQFEVRPLPRSESIFKRKHVRGEAWAPNGKSTGKIINGNGEWVHFSAEPDSARGQYNVYREVYRDSVMVKGEKLDSAEIAQLLK